MRTRLFAFLVALGVAAAAAAQTPVRLDLHVTQDGAPVQGLTAADITVVEDGVTQTITSFEYVQPPADGRARLYVVFLESEAVATPLVRFLDRLIGADDLVALVTPATVAAPLVFGGKANVISAIARGEGQTPNPKDRLYRDCYPDARPTAGVADEMIARRRETLALDALDALVARLDDEREERKAVITVSEGWRLYRESRDLARAQQPQSRRADPFGRRRADDTTRAASGVAMTECEADRNALARMNNSNRAREIAERANRATVSFYPITSSALSGVPSATGDARQETLRDLATETAGQALLADSDLEPGLARIAADLSSYYLLAYTSSNGLIDGGFRSVTVRVSRPGVRVRTRRGYRAPTAWELTGVDSDVTRAFTEVAAVSDRSDFRLRTAAWPRETGDGVRGVIWAVGELDPRLLRDVSWTAGGTADVLLVNAAGEELVSIPVPVDADTGTFTVLLDAPTLLPGEYALRARVRAVQDGVVPVTDVARVAVAARPAVLSEAVMWHRSRVTGPRFALTADPRFRRSERVRLELASAEAGTATARLLDRQGNPLPIPVTVTERSDESGDFRWLMAEVNLAPLTLGSYAIEVKLAGAARITAFSVVP